MNLKIALFTLVLSTSFFQLTADTDQDQQLIARGGQYRDQSLENRENRVSNRGGNSNREQRLENRQENAEEKQQNRL